MLKVQWKQHHNLYTYSVYSTNMTRRKAPCSKEGASMLIKVISTKVVEKPKLRKSSTDKLSKSQNEFCQYKGSPWSM